jgi:thiol-disulfide isomerase/thioredoxin
LTEPEQRQVLGDVKAYLTELGPAIKPADAALALRTAMGLELGKNPELAPAAYADLARLLAKTDDPKIADSVKTLNASVRRLQLPGHEFKVHGVTLDGTEFDWRKYRGKVVLVDFWATWCLPCIAELPNVRKNYEAYHDRGFDVVAISIDKTKDKPVKFMEARKLPWVCLFDEEPERKVESMADQYGVFYIPQAILVDRDGKVVSLHARGSELGRLLEKLLGPPKKSEDSTPNP